LGAAAHVSLIALVQIEFPQVGCGWAEKAGRQGLIDRDLGEIKGGRGVIVGVGVMVGVSVKVAVGDGVEVGVSVKVAVGVDVGASVH